MGSCERSFQVERTEIHFPSLRCKVKVSPGATWAQWILQAREQEVPKFFCRGAGAGAGAENLSLAACHAAGCCCSCPNIKVKCMRPQLCNILSTSPERPTREHTGQMKQNGTKGNCGQGHVTHDGFSGAPKNTDTHSPAHWQGQPRTHTDVYQSRDAGKPEGEYGFGFHFVVTLAATNRRNVRCLLHLTSTFFNHPLSHSPFGTHFRGQTCATAPINHESLETALKI